MDFLKRLFKGNKIKGVEISISQGQGLPSELAELLGGLNGGHRGHYEPLFLVKDHPEIERLFKAAHERNAFIQKQFESLEEQAEKSRKDLWGEIEQYMQAHGLWPKGVPFETDLCLAHKNGVIMQHRHE